MTTASERRLSPRSKIAFDCGIIENVEPIRSLTFDLSSRGLSCVLPREIPLFTKVRVILQIPLELADRDNDKKEIHCEGVVVRRERSDGEDGSHYKTAIYFSRIEPEDSAKLQRYVAKSH